MVSYDPLGFLVPYTLTAKLLLQKLCSINCNWDEEVPKVFCERWIRWIVDGQQFTNFNV